MPLLQDIKERPGVYLGCKSLSALSQFIGGFRLAKSHYKINEPDEFEVVSEDFHDWVASKTGFTESTLGWCSMILSTTENEAQAFDRFYELVEEKQRLA